MQERFSRVLFNILPPVPYDCFLKRNPLLLSPMTVLKFSYQKNQITSFNFFFFIFNFRLFVSIGVYALIHFFQNIIVAASSAFHLKFNVTSTLLSLMMLELSDRLPIMKWFVVTASLFPLSLLSFINVLSLTIYSTSFMNVYMTIICKKPAFNAGFYILFLWFSPSTSLPQTSKGYMVNQTTILFCCN